MAVPTITSVTPATGTTAGGTSVALVGTGFTGTTAVAFGTTPAASFTVVDNLHLTAVSPAEAAGLVDIVVTNGTGPSLAAAGDHFTFVAIPVVSSVTPAAGPVAGTTSVAIVGTGFTGTTAVTFGGTAATSFTVVDDLHLTAVAPAHAAGVTDIIVTNGGGPSASGAADHFTFVALPVVSSVTPSAGPVTGGTTVTVVGTGFTGATAVHVGASPAVSYTVVDSTHITAEVPVGTGTADITVTIPAGGTSSTGSGDHFTYGASYVQPEGSDTVTYFMDVAISPATVADGTLVQALDPFTHPRKGVYVTEKVGTGGPLEPGPGDPLDTPDEPDTDYDD